MSIRKVAPLVLAASLLVGPADAKPLTPSNQGYDQGRQAGRREGEEIGRRWGAEDGAQDGYQAGLMEARQQYLDQAYQAGQESGAQDGSQAGSQEGREAGLRQGREEGVREGEVSGRKSAEETALAEVRESARAAGLKRASKADPQADGQKQGALDGARRAAEFAAQDFARGRQDYRIEREARPVESQLEQRQGQISRLNLWQLNSDLLLGRRDCPPCKFRYLVYPSDNEEFQKAYRRGYQDGYESGFQNQYNGCYDSEFRRAASQGAFHAPTGDLTHETEAAYQQAFAASREQAYQQSLVAAREVAYTESFKTSFAGAYAATYPTARERHYKAEEEAAFQSVYGAAYLAAFEQASEAAYQKALPTARKIAYQEGRNAEQADFEKRPVRVLEAWLTPTDVEGLALVSIRLRNYAAQPVQGHRVRLFWNNENSRLYHSIPGNSEVIVTGAFKAENGAIADRDVEASLRTEEKDFALGKVTLWPKKP